MRTLYVRERSLYLMRSFILSQCGDLRTHWVVRNLEKQEAKSPRSSLCLKCTNTPMSESLASAAKAVRKITTCAGCFRRGAQNEINDCKRDTGNPPMTWHRPSTAALTSTSAYAS